MIPITEIPKPLYRANGPFALVAVLYRQSYNPLNCLSPLPTSLANLVLA